MSEISDKLFKQKEMVHVLMNKPLEDLKQYFIKSELTDNEIYSDLQFNINHAFTVAANSGKFNVVKYLLTSPELEMHADINFDGGYAMYVALSEGNLYLVDYLLTSDELKEHGKIPTNPNELEDIFSSICNYIVDVNEKFNEYECDPDSMQGRSYCSQIEDYYEVLYFLIYKCEVRPTKDIISILGKSTSKEFFKDAVKKLELNEIVQSLQEELGNNVVDKKKLKL
jgi:hypothetical protein